MTETQAAASAPNTIFSPDDSLETLWVKAYQGEILGELLFGGLAACLPDPDQARKMGVLATLERCTKEALVPSMQRAGLSLEPDAETLSLADLLVEASAASAWEDTVGSLEPITAQYSAMYERIGELDPTERETADLLVAHEAALATFGRLEMSGDRAASLAAIEALPHFQPA